MRIQLNAQSHYPLHLCCAEQTRTSALSLPFLGPFTHVHVEKSSQVLLESRRAGLNCYPSPLTNHLPTENQHLVLPLLLLLLTSLPTLIIRQ